MFSLTFENKCSFSVVYLNFPGTRRNTQTHFSKSFYHFRVNLFAISFRRSCVYDVKNNTTYYFHKENNVLERDRYINHFLMFSLCWGSCPGPCIEGKFYTVKLQSIRKCCPLCNVWPSITTRQHIPTPCANELVNLFLL